MIIRVFIILSILLLLDKGFAQDSLTKFRKKNVMYLSLDDDIGINYERFLIEKKHSRLGMRSGIVVSYSNRHTSDLNYSPRRTLWGYGLNFGVFYLLSYPNQKNHWELGLHTAMGITQGVNGSVYYQNQRVVYDSTFVVDSFINTWRLRWGFRHQRPNGGLMYKIGISPFNLDIGYNWDKRTNHRGWFPIYYLFPNLDIGIGWSF